MPVCDKCGGESPAGSVYCTECGLRLPGTEHIEQIEGRKMGEVAAFNDVTAPAPARRTRGFSQVWNIIGTAGKVVLAGAALGIIGFFVPTTSVAPPGLVVTRSLAMVGGGFLLIPVLCLLAMVLVFVSGQARPLRNRLFIYAAIVGIGAFVVPFAVFVWLSGLLGGLLILVGSALIIGGGFGMMSNSTQSLR